jgi:enoyl-CoA hydratase/carnithine racemase
MIGGVELKVTSYSVTDGVATVTLARPPGNAWTGRMHHEYRAGLAEAERDPGVRAIVVTGAGRAFCVGADARALDRQIGQDRYDPGVDLGSLPRPGFGLNAEFDELFAYHFGILKPIVAAINGPAAGVGLVLACFCDIRFAAAGAKLTVATPRLGLPAEYGLSWLLPRIVGLGHAADLLMSSRVIPAEEAAQIGLVNKVFAFDDLLPSVQAYAGELAGAVSPAALREVKRQLYADLHRGVGAAVRDAEASVQALIGGPDFREGVTAWREKRPPRFPPRESDPPTTDREAGV